MTTATAALLEAYPSMTDDADLMPLMRRMGVIEGILQANIQTQQDSSTTHADLVRLHEQQEGLLANVREINAKIESIWWERRMRSSVEKIENGLSRLSIRRNAQKR